MGGQLDLRGWEGDMRPKIKQRKFPGPPSGRDQNLPSAGPVDGSGMGKAFGKKKVKNPKPGGTRASYGDPFTGS